jgi:hypothetical protein
LWFGKRKVASKNEGNMPDPITIGALVATALSLAGEAIVKAGVTEPVKDAYQALKAKVSVWAARDTAELEKDPSSKSRQSVVAKEVDNLPEADQEALRELAELLVKRLKEKPGTIGLDVGRLEALDMRLGNVSVAAGIGVRIKEAKILGTFRTGDIEVGGHLGKGKR